jgi:hypothetical protein
MQNHSGTSPSTHESDLGTDPQQDQDLQDDEDDWRETHIEKYYNFYYDGDPYYEREGISDKTILAAHQSAVLHAKLQNVLPSGELFPVQLNTIRAIIPRLIQAHYKHLWGQLQQTIREMYKFRIEEFDTPIYTFSANRQVGKTYLQANICKSLLLSVDCSHGKTYEIILTAHRQELACDILQRIKEMLACCTYYLTNFTVKKNNTTGLVIYKKNEISAGSRTIEVVTNGRGKRPDYVVNDEFEFGSEDTHIQITGYFGVATRFGLYTSTPNRAPNCYAHKLSTDRTVTTIPCRIICDECLRKPPSEMIKCTCLGGLYDNPNKSIRIGKLRAQNKDPSQILANLEEHGGVRLNPVKRGYNPEHIRRIFDKNHIWRPQVPPKRLPWHFMYVDPNAGGLTSDTAAYSMFYDEFTERFVQTFLDTKCTANQREFVQFVFDAIDKLHKVIRKGNIQDAIVIAVESQKAFDGETIYRELQNRLKAGNTNYMNVHICTDPQRERDKSGMSGERHGFNINSIRQKNMHKVVSRLFEGDYIYSHEDLCTNYEWGLEMVEGLMIQQVELYTVPAEENANVGYDKNMNARPQGDLYGAKFYGKRDDLSDCLHGAYGTYEYICNTPFFNFQIMQWSQKY